MRRVEQIDDGLVAYTPECFNYETQITIWISGRLSAKVKTRASD